MRGNRKSTGRQGARKRFARLVACAAVLVSVAASLVPSSSAAQQATPLLRYPGTALNGTVLSKIVAAQADCERLCTAYTACAGISFMKTTNACQIFSDVRSARLDANSEAATRSPIGAYQSAFDSFDMTALNGVVSAEMVLPKDGCYQICNARSGCVGFDHVSATNACRLYAAVTGKHLDGGSTAEMRGTPQAVVAAPPPAPPVAPAPPPPAPPVEQASWHFARFDGVDLFGGDIYPKGIQARGYPDCANQCSSNSMCTAFTFNSEHNRCFLKSSYEFAQGVGVGTAGLYFKSKESDANRGLPVQWEAFLGQALSGSDIGQSSAQSYHDCLRSCEATNGCGGFNWVFNVRPGVCVLLTSDAQQRYGSPAKGVDFVRRANKSVVPGLVQAVPPRD